MQYQDKIKNFLLELGYEIVDEDAAEGLFVVDKEENGIKNMIVDCEDPILILEQYLFELPTEDSYVFQSLLKKNREIIHGAFVLDEDGKRVLFRDTLQLENIDINELEGSLNSLGLLLTEYYDQIIAFARGEAVHV